MIRITRHILLSIALMAPSSLAAQSSFQPPQGCTGTLTVQYRACLVSNIWTCEGDAAGEQWVSVFSQAGPFQVRKVDAEFQWLETYYAAPPRTEEMQLPAPDPESLTELFAEGYDTYDFTTVPSVNADPERYVGFDRLTGETTVIDGEVLLNTEYAYDQLDPAGNITASNAGRQFVSEPHRLFFFGVSWSSETPDDQFDASPVEFIYPGEAGFFSATPKFGCGVIMSSFEGAQ